MTNSPSSGIHHVFVPLLICHEQHSTQSKASLIERFTVRGCRQERLCHTQLQEWAVHLWLGSEAAEPPRAALQLKINGPV